MKKNVIVSIISMILVSTINAATDVGYSSLRSQAMGGVRITTAKDIHAVYANPALLSNVSNHLYLPFGVQFGASSDLTGKGLDSVSSFQNASSDSARLSALQLLVPSELAIQAQLPPIGWTGKGLGIGLFSASEFRASIVNPAQIRVRIQGYADTGLGIGLAKYFSFFDTPVSLGISAQYINRARYIDARNNNPYIDLTQASLISNGISAITANGTLALASGFGFDLGMSLPFGAGELGVVLNNVGGVALSGGYTTSSNVAKTYTENLPSTVLGVGYSQKFDTKFIPWVGKYTGLIEIAGDYRFLHNNYYKNIALGMEKLLFNDVVAVRFGLHQGYPSAGVGFDFNLVRLQYAFSTTEYGAHLGDNPITYHQIELNFPLY